MSIGAISVYKEATGVYRSDECLSLGAGVSIVAMSVYRGA